MLFKIFFYGLSLTNVAEQHAFQSSAWSPLLGENCVVYASVAIIGAAAAVCSAASLHYRFGAPGFRSPHRDGLTPPNITNDALGEADLRGVLDAWTLRQYVSDYFQEYICSYFRDNIVTIFVSFFVSSYTLGVTYHW